MIIFQELMLKYSPHAEAREYLEKIKEDLLKNAREFKESEKQIAPDLFFFPKIGLKSFCKNIKIMCVWIMVKLNVHR